MLVGDQVICEMHSLEMTSLVAGSIDNQIPSATLVIFLLIFSSQLSPLSRHPSCQTPSKRQTSPDTRNPQCSEKWPQCKTLMEWHPAVFLYYRSLSRSDTEKDTVHLLHRSTEKHYHRNVQNFVEDHIEKESWPPQNSISKDSHWNSIWFVFLSPYPPNECWPPVFLEASPPGR